ncbi:MAG: NosD domain-containing protein [Thermoplasmatota archaeon]
MRRDVCLLSVLLIIFSSTHLLTREGEPYKFDYGDVEHVEPPSSYTLLARTEIDGDMELSNFTRRYSFPGNGSVSSPYIIEKAAFPNADDLAGLALYSISMHLIIRDCFFRIPASEKEYSDGSGILIFASSNITIEDCTFHIKPGTGLHMEQCMNISLISCRFFSKYFGDWWDWFECHGAFIWNCEDIDLRGNEFLNCEQGIYLFGVRISVFSNIFIGNQRGVISYHLSRSDISRNHFMDTEDTSIHLNGMIGPEEVRIEQNSIRGEIGISIEGGINTTIRENRITSDIISLSLGGGLGNRIIDNIIEGPGISCYANRLQPYTNIYSGNSINELPLVFINGRVDQNIDDIDEIGQLIVVNSSRLRLGDIVVSRGVNSITILNSDNITLDDPYLGSSDLPFRCQHSENIEIKGLHLENDGYGLNFDNVDGIDISDSVISTNFTSIELERCGEVRIDNNDIHSERWGIEASDCMNILVESNRDRSLLGMRFPDSRWVDVHNNTFTDGAMEFDITTIHEGELPEPTGNLFNGKERLYLWNREEYVYETVSELGEIYCYNVSGSEIRNVTVREGVMVTFQSCTGVSLRGANISATEVRIENCEEMEISGSVISDNVFSPGITISRSEDIVISNNTVSQCRIGMFITGSKRVRIVNNDILGILEDGVLLKGNTNEDHLFDGNLISSCGGCGIRFENEWSWHDDRITIANNTFVGSWGYAIELLNDTVARIHHNAFIGNNGTGDRLDKFNRQVRVEGYASLYDSRMLEGNYWYDYRPGIDHDTRDYNSGYFVLTDGDHISPDYYPLERPPPGCPIAPGYEKLWKPLTLEEGRDYTTGYCCLSVVLVVFLLIVFMVRNNAVNRRDIFLQHRKRPWEYENPKKKDTMGRVTPRELRVPPK